jgi:AcrR family transcriptional regulator
MRSAGPSDEGRQDDTRARLLQAAAEVFAERGFEAATVREICRQAHANVALVNYHFGDKLELYTEVLKACVPSSESRLQPDDTNPEEALRKMIRAMLERVLEKEGRASLRYRLMLHEFVHPSAATARIVDVTLRPVYDRLRAITGAIAGLPPGDDRTRMCVHSVIGQVAHYAHAGPVVRTLWPKLKMTPAQCDVVADHIADFTLMYLRNLRRTHSSGATGADVPADAQVRRSIL